MQVKLANHHFTLNPLWFGLTLTAFIILINLSLWQLNRAEEKTQQLTRLATLQSAGALELSQLTNISDADRDGVLVQGQVRWLSPTIWLLDNQIVGGQVGYDVIIPVQANDLTQPLLVNLGWIAATKQRDVLPQPQINSEFTLSALLRTKVDGLMLLGQNAEQTGSWPMRIQQINYAELSQMSHLTLYPALLYQQTDSDFVPHYKPVVLPPEKHRGYALQWFLLAVVVLGVALAASHQGKAKHE